jgi:uncharacterized membrane protein YccC
MQSDNGSRLDRIEAIVLELATASVRHDNEFSRINAVLEQVAQRQDQTEAMQQANAEQIALNRQDISALTASIQDLRNLVADYIQSRSQIGES